MKISAVVLAILAFSAHASADQCQLVDRAKAAKALRVLTRATTVQTFCAPCGDRAVVLVDVKKISMENRNTQGYWESQGYWEVKINDQGIDLAYTYVNGTNLAMMVGCPAQGVSASVPRSRR